MSVWLDDSDFFTDADMLDDTYTHIGIACGCDNNAGADSVRCGFILASVFIANEVSVHEPLFQDYTASGAACTALEGAASLYNTNDCPAGQYEHGVCYPCSFRIRNCADCTYDESAQYQVVCSSCAPGYSVQTTSGGGTFC